jgi:hypothetical protein
MHERAHGHRPLCTIELIVQGHAERCPGEECAFWEHGCVLSRIETELELRPDVAQLLLDLRGELEHGRSYVSDDARAKLARILNTEERIDREA